MKDKEKKRAYDRVRYANADKAKIMAQRKTYYEANKTAILARCRARTLRRLAKNRAIVLFAKSKPCMDCKNSFPPCCMDFDHRPGEQKFASISAMQSNWQISTKIILTEIAKCDLVCANCHRIRTYNRIIKNGIPHRGKGRRVCEAGSLQATQAIF